MLSKEELGKYLKKIRTDKDISLREVYKRTGITYSHLSMIENGKRNVTPALLKNLAQLYNVGYIDLYEKAGYIDLIENEQSDLIKKIGTLSVSSSSNMVKIPVIRAVRIGCDYFNSQNVIDTIQLEYNFVEDGSEYFALRVKDDRMSPVFIEGDIVIVKKQNNCESGQLAIVVVSDAEGTIKKVRNTEHGIILQHLNPAYEPLIYTNEEVKSMPIIIVGIVKQLRREF